MERVNEKYILDLVRNLVFPPLEIEIQDYGKNYLASDITYIKWGNKSYRFHIEVKSQSTPKMLDNAVNQLKKIISKNIQNAEKLYPLLIAPYLSEESLNRLAAENISGIDLSGNGLVVVPNKLFVYRFGAKNKFPSNAPIKNVFRGVSSIVPRVLFTEPEFENATEILKAITDKDGKTTLSTVSKVLKTLEEELLISRKERIRLIDGKSLLKNLRENYQSPTIERKVIGKIEDLDNTLIHISENAVENDFLCAIDKPRRYAVMGSDTSTTRVYTEDIDKSLAEISFSETSRFPNLEIIQTSDPTVYFDRRYELAVGAFYTSPLQVYLELANGGKREKEIAEQIEEGLLNFRY